MSGKTKSLRVLTLGGREITFTQERKKVKNINLRIHADGTIYLSAGDRVPQATIDAFVYSRAAKILRIIDAAALRNQTNTADDGCRDGSVLRIFGRDVTLRVSYGRPEPAVFDNGELKITVTRNCGEARLKAAVDEYKLTVLRQLTEIYCRNIHGRMAHLGVTYPEIRFRNMKTRWGSCIPAKKVITFNTRLGSCPPECIEYVVIHEFVHFLHPDHSKAFYRTLEEYLPDWRERKSALNG